MKRSINARVLMVALLVYPLGLNAQAKAQDFETMAQPEDSQVECKAPRPPKELNSFAYVRNGYREILRIEAYQAAISIEDCDCPFLVIDWQHIADLSGKFITSDNPKLPFDVIKLRTKADKLETELQQNCER